MILTEAKFYALVERAPMRSQSAAWERISSSSTTDSATTVNVPPELEAWVKAAKEVDIEHKSSHKTVDVSTTEPSLASQESP